MLSSTGEPDFILQQNNLTPKVAGNALASGIVVRSSKCNACMLLKKKDAPCVALTRFNASSTRFSFIKVVTVLDNLLC